MEKRKEFHNKQQLPVTQLNEVQDFVQDSMDHIVYDAVTDGLHFTGFTAAQTSTVEVTLEPGRLFKAGFVYTHEAPQPLNFLSNLPQSTEKICAVVASSQVGDANITPIKFITNVETRETQPQTVTTEKHRLANLAIISGLESAAPQKPTIEVNLMVICWVWLDNAGITKVEMNEAGRLPSVKRNAGRLSDMEAWRKNIGQRIDTVSSDITALSQRQSQAGSNAVMYQMAGDIANLKELLELEDGYSAYGANRFLDTDESDTGNVNFNCKVEEGVRFANDAADLQALDVFNQYDPNIIISDGFLLPKYTEVERIGVTTRTDETPISQYPFETVDVVQKTISRKRIRYGNVLTYCTNSAWWRSGRWDNVQKVFYKDGDAYEVLAGSPNGAHSFLRLRKFWFDEFTETYWDRIVNKFSVNGAMVSQSFLNSQDTWMTSLELFLTQVAPTGDMTILLTETAYGKPDVNNVIQSITLTQADMQANDWTKIPFPATFLNKGKLYGLCLITQGNHYVAMTSGENYSFGTFFYSTDGQFLQGDLTKDMCFKINAAQFISPRIEVPLEALSLSGGIAQIDLMAQMIVPDAAELRFEIKPAGGTWYPLDEVTSGATAFNGLPPLCEFRAVFIGTKDVMPGINLTTSTYEISRPKTVGKHISTVITLDAPTQSLKIPFKIEEFYEANHDCTVTIDDVTNGVNDIAPGTTTDFTIGEGDDANHLNITRTFEWTATEIVTPTSQIRININIATSSAQDVFHGSELVYLAF